MTKTSTRRRFPMKRSTTPQVKEAIASVLAELPEPASAGEIRAKVSQLLEIDIENSRVASLLKEMHMEGLVFHRLETKEERHARAGKPSTRGMQGKLWWTSPEVPTRKTTELFPGIRLGDGSAGNKSEKKSRLVYYKRNRERLNEQAREYNEEHRDRLKEIAELNKLNRAPRKIKKKKRVTAAVSTPAPSTPRVVTPDLVIDGLVAEVANGRIEKLKARIAELEAQMAEIRKIVRS